MKKNMGNADRVARLLLALLIVGLYLLNIITGTLAYVLLAIAGIFVLTSLVSFCPLYSIFKIKTVPKEQQQKTS
ncbi:MAG TPA: DUF2892 domain-containing protein [Chitinophagaceae bacterium]|jgi:hypothetical protein|nr:DUF2892 domain-containing protein [Chitinophagaceae bacterium]